MFKRLEQGFERLLVGKRQPTPKSIRDLGKSVAQAQLVQSIIEGLPAYYPHPHDIEDTETGYDSDGNFHHPRAYQPKNRWDDMGNYTVDL